MLFTRPIAIVLQLKKSLMEQDSYNTTLMREDKQLLILTHLSQLLDLITVIGGFLVPLVIWLTQREKVFGMNTHGKMILNFQISMFIYSLISIPLVLLLGLGFLMLGVIALILLIFPIINAVKVSNGELPYYPFTIKFFK